MFLTADWTKPQTGGLLSQIIVKEEQQLREPKPRVPVSNVWDPEDLRGRPTTWKESVKLRRGDCRRPGTMGETLSYQKRATDMRYCRSKMMHERRSNDILEAFERQQALDDAQKVRRPGTSAPPSTVANVTHQLFEQMRPTYGMNDTFATVTTSQLIGMGAKTAPAAGSDYAKPRGNHDARWVTRNGADRLQTEAALHEVQNRKPEPPAPSLVDTLRSKRAAATAASTGGGPRGGFHSLGGGGLAPAPRGNAALFGASAPSTFCVRPNDVPLSRLQDTKVRQPDNYRNSRDIRGYAKGEVFKLG